MLTLTKHRCNNDVAYFLHSANVALTLRPAWCSRIAAGARSVRRVHHPGDPLKACIPIFVIAGAAGAWLGLVLLVLRAFGIRIA
jgi:hypothetical protein